MKCNKTQATYRELDDDTEEIPVSYNGRPMFADPISMVLKPNGTKVKSGTYLPIKWKIGGVWFCKHIKRTKCAAPLQFEPENGKTARYMLNYDDIPWAGGEFSAKDIAAHEQTIFYEESKQKALDDLSDDMVNLRPTKISQMPTLDSIWGLLEELFYISISKPHAKAMILLTFVYFIDNLFGFFGRVSHLYRSRSRLWKFLLTPFHQIFTLIVLPWGILLQSKNCDAELSDELKTHINNHVKIDIE